MLPEAQAQLKSKLSDLLAHIMAAIVTFDDEKALDHLFDDGHAIERSVDFSTSFVTVGNVLGYSPKNKIGEWIPPDGQRFPLRRSEAWDAEDRHAPARLESVISPNNPRSASSATSRAPADAESTTHGDMETVSPIRLALWDRAGWSGTMFITTVDDSSPPVLAPVFTNEEAGRQILSQWREEFGAEDGEERIRITIIRGIDHDNPHAYRVVIGPNVTERAMDAKSLFFSVSHINTMTPPSDANLRRFLRSFEVVGRYYLTGAVVNDERTSPVPVPDTNIIKRELNVRDAWQIGMNDPDVVGIRENDHPIIPPGQLDPPVLEVLQWLGRLQLLQGPSRET
jgi:hypothetical protein